MKLLALASLALTTLLVSSPPSRLTTSQFEQLMHRVADAWNANDARMAASYFTEDATYSAPGDSHVRCGRQALYEFFVRPRPMHMEWHHLVFDEARQIGAGEYTFTYDIRTHGVAMVRLVDGRIANWREYEIASPLPWEQLVGENRF
jgi:uncharacterized protein (TIGR02246 family)